MKSLSHPLHAPLSNQVGRALSVAAALGASACGSSSRAAPDGAAGKDATAADAPWVVDSAAADSAQAPDASAPIDGAPAIDAGAVPDATVIADAAVPDASPDAAMGAGFALTFTGAGYVEAPAAFALPTGDFTIEAWVQPTAFPTGSNEMQVIAKDRNGVGANQYRLGIDSSGRAFFMASDAAGGGNFWSGDYVLLTQALPLATWSHLAVTRSGTAYTLFLGTATVASLTSSVAPTGGTNPLRIGARVSTSGTDGDNFMGSIDEVRIWHVARTPADLAAAMSQTIAPSDPAFPGLTSYWRFDDGTGTTAIDLTGASPAALTVASGSPAWTTSTAF